MNTILNTYRVFRIKDFLLELLRYNFIEFIIENTFFYE